MKTIVLVTKSKITADKVSNLLIENFPYSKKCLKNDEDALVLGKTTRNFLIVYKDSISIDDKECLLDEEDRKHIPFQNAVCNGLVFDLFEIAQYVVKIISSVYPELIVVDEYDFTGTAEEFIKRKY